MADVKSRKPRDQSIEYPQELIEQVRRLGPDGPAYQIVELDEDGNVVVEVINSGERVTFPLAEVLKDPMAETIP